MAEAIEPTRPTDDGGGRTVSIGMLVFGALFVALGIAGIADAETDPAWIWAGVLAAAGVAGLAGAIRSLVGGRSNHS